MVGAAVLLALHAFAEMPPAGSAQADALEAAQLLGLTNQLAGLSAGNLANPAAAREEVARRILGASFEVDSAIAAIQDEQAAVAEALAALQSDRDARLGTLNLAAAVFAAGAAVGTGMTLSDGTVTAGTWVTTVASGIGAALALYAALAPGAGIPPVRTRSNLLAPFFGRPVVSAGYPAVVWAYLERVPPGETASRRQQLVALWKRLGRIDGGPSDAKMAVLALPISERRPVDIGALQDRALMLADVRAHVASMKQAFLALLQAMDQAR